MKASTAVALIALGSSSLLLLRVPSPRRRTMVVGSLLTATGIVATLALVEYVARVQVGVDTLLFHDDTAVAAPARMSIGTSIGLLLLAGSGAALLMARLRGPITIALCTLVVVIASLSVLGHLFMATELRGGGGSASSTLVTPPGHRAGRALAMRPVDLAQIAAEAVEVQQTGITVSRAVVRIEELPVIDGEPGLLRQLFVNLIGNAVKFARPGARPEVTLAGQALPADASGRRFAEVRVSDDGIGFDPQYAERIFEIFERLATDTDGTGIGLAICKKVVDFHGGTIAATSTPGEGTTFTTRLPMEHSRESLDER